MMSEKTYEDQYLENLTAILQRAPELNLRTGIATRRLPSTQIIVDLQKEFPILLSKKVYWKSAVQEILWIMQKQSNVTSELGNHIWDNWTGSDGTIGKSYGYQIAKPCKGYSNQVEYVLDTLSQDKSNRQCVINMWNVSELDEMNLVPCVYSSVWNIIDGKLNCMLVQRSADYPIGVPFDTLQYAVLVHLFARHLDVKPGLLTHVMADSHIYENQVDGAIKQSMRINAAKNITKPTLEITGSKNFWEVTLDNISVKNYTPMSSISYEIAV